MALSVQMQIKGTSDKIVCEKSNDIAHAFGLLCIESAASFFNIILHFNQFYGMVISIKKKIPFFMQYIVVAMMKKGFAYGGTDQKKMR